MTAVCKDQQLQYILLTVVPHTVGQTPCRLPGRQSLRVHAEADKEADLGKEVKPQEAGGTFYNDERPVSLTWGLLLICICDAILPSNNLVRLFSA